MNIFGIGALVVFALCAGTSLWQMYRYKARYESKQAFHAEILEQVQQIAESHAEERAGLTSQINTLSKDNLMLIDRMHNIEAERDALREQLDTAQTREKAAGEQRRLVQEHLDVLSAPKKPRSRAKPPTTTD